MTRHNVGWLALDDFSEQNNCSPFADNPKFKSHISKNILYEREYMLIKPQTFMNNSGEAVAILANFYKIDLSKDLLVVYDDVDLKLGNMRFRPDGAAGTHNGMKSVLQMLGTENFPRLRIGIESRGDKAPLEQDIHSFVLSNWMKEEKDILLKILKETSSVIENFIKGEISLAFSQSVL